MSMRAGSSRLDSQQAAQAMLFERRLLMATSMAVVLGLILWVISISTEYWFSVTCPRGAAINATWRPQPEPEPEPPCMMTSHAGLWRMCRTVLTNGTASCRNDSQPTPQQQADTSTMCRYMRVKFLPDRTDDDPLNVIIAYRRTCLGFSVISLLLLALSIFFSMYTFRVRRYTFKRVAACLHFIVAGVQLVVIEVLVTSLHYQELHVPSVFPDGCHWNYSASFVLGWFCFVINLAAGVGFIYSSTKKKKRPEGNTTEAEAEDDFDDEPQIMGR